MRALIWLPAMLVSAFAQAANLEVTPTSVQVAAPAGAGAITLTNVGEGSARAQVRVFSWRQDKGDDVLTATDAIVASPPGLVLAPRQPYTIRIIRRGEAPRAEEAYRLVIDELPEPARNTEAGKVTVAIRLNLPVFFAPAAVNSEKLSAALQDSALLIRNDGGRRARLSDVTLVTREGARISIVKGLAGYALAGSVKRIPLPRSAALATSKLAGAKVSIVTDRGPIDAPLLSTR